MKNVVFWTNGKFRQLLHECPGPDPGFYHKTRHRVRNRQLRAEVRAGEQMPGETGTGQGTDSQHFTNTNCYNSMDIVSLVSLFSLK